MYSLDGLLGITLMVFIAAEGFAKRNYLVMAFGLTLVLYLALEGAPDGGGDDHHRVVPTQHHRWV